MVLEARDVIAASADEFRNSFDSFADELGEMAKSFSAASAGSIVSRGLEKIITGLRLLGEILKSDALQQAIRYMRDVVKNLDLQHVLASAFGCSDTKDAISKLKLYSSANPESLRIADDHMAELSSRYVVLLKQARWVLAAVQAAGSLLVLTGIHYAALGMPVAYAIVAVATVLIGIDFAHTRMHGLIMAYRGLGDEAGD